MPEETFTQELEEKMRLNTISMDKWQSEILQWSRNWTYINCWHMNDLESAAMWSLYATSNQAIAIQSTFHRLKNCLSPYIKPPQGEPILGMVYYIDYDQDEVRKNTYLSEYFYKRRSYSHEHELRAIIQELPLKNNMSRVNQIIGPDDHDYDKAPANGKSFSVNLEELIEQVYVAPTSPDWFFELTKKIMNKFGFNKSVRRSSLDTDPIY